MVTVIHTSFVPLSIRVRVALDYLAAVVLRYVGAGRTPPPVLLGPVAVLHEYPQCFRQISAACWGTGSYLVNKASMASLAANGVNVGSGVHSMPIVLEVSQRPS